MTRLHDRVDVRSKATTTILLLFVIFMITGCGHFGKKSYLKNENYQEGLKFVQQELQDDPDDPSDNYYAGRYLLALERNEEALVHLQRTVLHDSAQAEYQFWLGVAFWALCDFDKEKAAYHRAIAISERYSAAHLYLGHNYLDSGDWKNALKQYDMVLDLEKHHPDALFNRAVAQKGLGRLHEQNASWKKYLKYYPDGKWALKAVENLNLRGDFSYRSYLLGACRLVLRRIEFKSDTAKLKKRSLPSLDVVGEMMNNNKGLSLHLVAYCQDDAELARLRTVSIRKYITSRNPGVKEDRLLLSWFGVSESISGNGKTHSEKESVNFITEVK